MVPISIQVSSCLVLPPILLPLYIPSSYTSATTSTATSTSGGCNADSIARSSPRMRHAASNFPHVDAKVRRYYCQIAATIKCTAKTDDLFQSGVCSVDGPSSCNPAVNAQQQRNSTLGEDERGRGRMTIPPQYEPSVL